MALLTILEFPDSRLRTRAQSVEVVTDALRTLISDMLATMYNANGIGLAATQVNVHQRILVIDLSEERNQPMVFINPEITHREGTEIQEEGCLSVPNFYEPVTRSQRIVVKALDADGQSFELTADGLLAACIQHEIDHLDGKLFVDYLSTLKRDRIRKKLEKEHRERQDKPRYPVRETQSGVAR